jgi:glycosyltransferase involved in cell wall biosynthesis
VTEGSRGTRRTAASKSGDTKQPAKPRRARPKTTTKKTTTAKQASRPAEAVSVFEGLGRAAKPVRVAVRLHAYPPGHNAGSEWMLHSMLRALAARGHTVQVWLSRYSSARHTYVVDGLEVVPFAARMDFGAAVRDADVVVSHLENVPPTAGLAQAVGKPFVAVCHNTDPIIFKNVGRSGAALVVYNSAHMERTAREYFQQHPEAVEPARSLVVRPPVFGGDYATTPGDHVTLINLNRDKGGDVFWKVAERLPDVRFLGVKGAYGRQVERRGGLPNVEVIDHLPGNRMRDEVYARTRVLLMPSAHESWGRTAVEAMGSGIPVVAAPTPGLVECLADAGVFVELGDLDGWAATVEALTDPAHWEQASKAASARAAELDPAADLSRWCEAIEALA